MNQQKNMNKQNSFRYEYVDILKLFCAFLVICIHNPYKNAFWFWVEPWTRIAVPLFFMISGYFYINEHQLAGGGRIVKIFKLCILWYMIYGVMEFVVKLHPVSMQGWTEYTTENFFTEFMKFLLANKPMLNLGGALWYLFALGYVYLIYGFAAKNRKVSYLIRAGVLLMILQYVFGMYSFVFGMSTAAIRTRNFLMTGLPFFGLGIWLKQTFKSRPQILKHSAFIKVLLICFLFSSVVEKYILIKYIGLEISSDIYLSTLFLAVVVFVYALAQEETQLRSPLITNLAAAGRKYSTGVYLVHAIVLCCIDQILYRLGVPSGNIIYKVFPVVIFLISLLCVALGKYLIKKIFGYVSY